MKLIDLSRPLHSGMVVWPGDTATDFGLVATKAGGYSCNVGRLTASMHAGTHVDAPFHFDDRGAKIDAVAPERYVGPARVIDARGHAQLTPALLAWLGAHGIGLVGIDFPSVDAPTSKELPTHHALHAADVLILENLDLSAVAPGVYELIALPLKIQGADGSPVRAVLRVID